MLSPVTFSGVFGANKTKNQPVFYPAKPNRFVMGATEKAARTVAKIADINIVMTDEDRAKIDALRKSGDAVIFTPNHSTALDGLVLISSGIRTTRMGAKEIFQKGKLHGKFLQWNNVFSVDRDVDASKSLKNGVDVVASGKWLTMFPQGHVNWKHHLASPEEFKLGAANIAMQAAQREKADGTHQNVKIVPLTFLFEPKGNPEKIRKAMGKATDLLEKKVGQRLGHTFEKQPDLTTRLEFLFGKMVEEREQRYGKLYDLSPDTGKTNYYDRLDDLQTQILDKLEMQYEGETQHGSFERRARKLKGHIKTLENPSADDKQNVKTLQDIILGLSMYEKDYLNDDIGRQIEVMSCLARDIKGDFYSMRKILRFLQRADVEAKVVVGDPINVNEALQTHLTDTDEQKKALAIDLTGRIQEQIQSTMNSSWQASASTGKVDVTA